jgi:hypothetical protein
MNTAIVMSGDAFAVVTPRRCTSCGSFGVALRHAVLHEHLRLVDVGAELERHRQRHDAVAGRLRELVEHVLDTGDRLLERAGDRVGDDFRIRARIGRAHDDGRRHDFRYSEIGKVGSEIRPPIRIRADRHAGEYRA